MVTSTALGPAPVVTATGAAGQGAVGVVTQYVTAQVTGTDAQGRTTTGQTVEQVILTVTNTAPAGSGGGGEPQLVTVTATNAQEPATGGVVVVTLTESSTSTEANGSQVVVVKVRIMYIGRVNRRFTSISFARPLLHPFDTLDPLVPPPSEVRDLFKLKPDPPQNLSRFHFRC